MIITLIYSTFPSKEKALEAGNDLLAKKLIACYNTHEMTSGYVWENKTCQEDEFSVIFKTTKEKVGEAKSFLEKIHPYDLPCIISWEVETTKKYYDWVLGELKS